MLESFGVRMHLADALVSPGVGGAFWAVTAASTAVSSRAVARRAEAGATPLMGMAGAFVFAAQMVNFAIPGTGSSGHLGGGLLLAVLLGPDAAIVVMASVLLVQALFFADGGLLAFGCNVFNLGLLPAFVAYPFVFRPLAGPAPGPRRLLLASVAAAVVGLELGALGVACQALLSAVTPLPPRAFLLALLPVHVPIGVVEGVVTAAVLTFVRRARPGLLSSDGGRPGAVETGRRASDRPVVAGLLLLAVLAAGVLSLVASKRPDGLEWSVARAARGTPAAEHGPDGWLAALQKRLAILPDYELPASAGGGGTPLAGLAGAAVTLALVAGAATLLRRRGARRAGPP